MSFIIYFVFIHLTLSLPGFVLFNKIKLFKDPDATLCFSYIFGIILFGFLAIFYFVFGFDLMILRVLSLLFFFVLIYLLIKDKLYRQFKFSFAFSVFVLFSLIPLLFVSLPFGQKYNLIPDPTPIQGREYRTFNVKILNLAKTPANDNYVPFRQAQFFVNRMDINKDSFIREWGVNFFYRTPLMGSVVAYYFDLTGEKLPTSYLWASDQKTYDPVYKKFQIISSTLNSLFILSAFILLKKLFNFKTACLSLIFIAFNFYFLYNTFFSWPKLFVAYFILCAWYLLLYDRKIILLAISAGLAYFTHDLAILYIMGLIVFLILSKEYNKTVVFGLVTALLISPWYIVSRLIYHQQSLFLYYPFFLHGLGFDPHLAVKEFFNTPITQITKIKLKYLYYLLTPFYFLKQHSEGFTKIIFLTTIFTLPGAIGILSVPAYVAVFKKLIKYYKIIVSFIVVPILTSAVLVGNPIGTISALHYLHPVVVLGVGFGIFYLLKFNRLFLIVGLLINLLIYFLLFLNSYNFDISLWLSLKPLTVLISLGLIYLLLLGKFAYCLQVKK